MKVGSLFSGIGGFDLGLRLPVSWQVEQDKDCNRVLAHHFPETKRYSDVKEVGKANLAPVDLICGGFPCQDLSVAGKRAGLGGERSGLWFEFHRIIREIRPGWVLIENVPGLLSSDGGRDFAVIISGLGELGYFTAWRVLDSQWFGVAQRRRRVFIVASLGDGRCAEVLFESSCGCGNPPARREAGEEVAGTIAGGSCESRRGYRNDLDTQGAFVCDTLRGGSPGGSTHGKPSGTDRGPFVVGSLSCNTGPRGHDAGNLMCNQAVDAGHIIPVLSLTERTRKEGRECEWQEDVAYCLDNPGKGGRSQTRLVAYGGNRTSGPIDKATACYKKRGGFGISENHDISPTLESEGGTHQGGPEKVPLVMGFKSGQSAQARSLGIEEEMSPSLEGGGGGNNRPCVAIQDCREMEKKQNGLGINEEDLAYTVDQTGAQGVAQQVQWASGGGKVLNDTAQALRAEAEHNYQFIQLPMLVRRLTPTECLRLQGFPDDWLDLDPPVSDSAKYRMVGNAVTVSVISWIGSRIMEAAKYDD